MQKAIVIKMVWKVGGGIDDKRVAECWQLMEMGDGYIEFIILFCLLSLCLKSSIIKA